MAYQMLTDYDLMLRRKAACLRRDAVEVRQIETEMRRRTAATSAMRIAA